VLLDHVSISARRAELRCALSPQQARMEDVSGRRSLRSHRGPARQIGGLPRPCVATMTPQELRRAGLCVGCGACGEAVLDAHGRQAPQAAPDVSAFCPFSLDAAKEDDISRRRFPAAPNASALIGRFEAAYVGHVAESDFRAQGSSGGL
jgi:hypothetical protein